MPVTRPRRRTNQRFAISAASGTEIAPVAMPLTTPQSRTSCHGALMKTVRREPIDDRERAPIITRFSP